MKAALALVLVAACGPPRDGCERDGDCGGGLKCARNGECLPGSDLWTVRVTWTIRGQPASTASCGSSPDLYLMFHGFDAADSFGFEPVPCESGLFTIDKLPSRFSSVEIGDHNRIFQEKVIDSQGRVSFDLAP